MKKTLLIAIAASTLISASAMAAVVACPTAAQVNAGLSQSPTTHLWSYHVGAFTQTTPGSLTQPTADAIVAQTYANAYPQALHYKNTMSCSYTSTMNAQGVTLGYNMTAVKVDTAAAGNQWKSPTHNGVYFCGSSVSAQCTALTK